MALIYRTEFFDVVAEDHPLIDRNDGGHITINPRFRISERRELTPQQAIALMRLTIVTGQAMDRVMNLHGVDIGRINYQDNGNWAVFKPEGPQLHIHVYGRAKSAVRQPYGQACYFPHKDEQPEFYRDLKPLTRDDIEAIGLEIRRLMMRENFSDRAWGIRE
jgi:diadenosine tetraphosphate (Ap4A) HIT family hydrolase